MVFITRSLKNCQRLKWRCQQVCAMLVGAVFFAIAGLAHAETPVALNNLKLERKEGAVYLSAEWQFEMSSALEDALTKGITLYFVTEVDVRQERWYFYNQRVSHAERHVRLFYQPLTRRWRVNVSPQPFTVNGLGVIFGQSYDNLEDAMDAVRRITPWRIVNLNDISLDAKPSISISFKLDLTQLPRPMQIGAVGHSDWNIEFAKTQRLELPP
jgi:hypothetical protein